MVPPLHPHHPHRHPRDARAGNPPLTSIFILSYIHYMECSVLFTDEFERWWDSLNIEEQESVTYSVDLLARLGVELKFPHSSGVSE